MSMTTGVAKMRIVLTNIGPAPTIRRSALSQAIVFGWGAR